jgi:hypothetical protein
MSGTTEQGLLHAVDTSVVQHEGSIKDDIAALLAREAKEQAKWSTSIPPWHPRNETTDTTGESEAEGDEGEDDVEEQPEAEAAEQPEASGGDDRVIQALEQFGAQITDRIGQITAPAQPQAEPEAEADFEEQLDAIIDELPDEHFDDEGNLTAEGMFAAMSTIAREAAREEFAPHAAERDSERRAAEADELEEKYPQLRDAKVQDEIWDKSVALARQLGKPELAAEPAFFERVYLAHEAEQRVAAETPASDRPSASVERSSAAPAKPAKQEDDGDRIVKLAKSSHFRLGQ